MELIKIQENCYYLKGAVNIGLVTINGKAVVIDTGIDKQTAKSIKKILEENNWQLTHIINTHAHADHFSGSQYLKEIYQAKVLAPKIEAIIMGYPIYEPFYLFGGAHPINELKNKFLQGTPVIVDEYLKIGPLSIENQTLEIVPLPGHTMGQIGVFFSQTLYLADAAFSPQVLKKHGIPYFVDLDLQFKTLDFLETTNCSYYLPAHGELVANIKELTVSNRQYLYNLTDKVRKLLPGTTEEIVAKLLNSLKINLSIPGQYFLMRAATLAHLSYLNNCGEVTWKLDNNIFKWKLKTHPDSLVKQ